MNNPNRREALRMLAATAFMGAASGGVAYTDLSREDNIHGSLAGTLAAAAGHRPEMSRQELTQSFQQQFAALRKDMTAVYACAGAACGALFYRKFG
jgi:hypothetical protein